MSNTKSGLRKEVGKLASMVASMGVRQRKKPTIQPPKAATKRRARLPLDKGDGSIRIKKEEVFLTLTTDATGGLTSNVSLRPGDTDNSMGYLAAQCKLHERIRYTSLSLQYVGAVGTTQGGVVFFGIDWINPKDKVTPTLTKVVALTPNTQCPSWGSAKMVIPLAKFQPQRWLDVDTETEGNFPRLLVFASGAPKTTSIGYFRVRYEVELVGTRSP